MSVTAVGWLLGIMAYGSFVLAVPFVTRLCGGERRLVAAIASTAFVIFMFWILVLRSKFDRDLFWSFLAMYSILFIASLQVFVIVYKSISLRMLVEISNQPTASLSLDKIHCLIVVNGAYLRRLANLEAGGIVTRRAGSITLTKKGQRVVLWIDAAQRIFGVAASG